MVAGEKMCGIVGLFLKNQALEPKLGSMMAGMLETMCDRGPDSAGFAVYGAGEKGHIKLTVRAMSPRYDFANVATWLSEAIAIMKSSLSIRCAACGLNGAMRSWVMTSTRCA